MTHALSAILTQASPPARDGLAMASDVAAIIEAVAIIVVAFFAIRVLIGFQRTITDVRRGFDRSLGPVSDRARSISDNVDFITQALRTDVERLNASVKALSGRLQQASDRMEERIEDFNALMEVVQSEAEDIFLDTAATMRGVKEGARAIGRPDEHEEGSDVPLPATAASTSPRRAEPPEAVEGGESEEIQSAAPGGA